MKNLRTEKLQNDFLNITEKISKCNSYDEKLPLYKELKVVVQEYTKINDDLTNYCISLIDEKNIDTSEMNILNEMLENCNIWLSTMLKWFENDLKNLK